MKGHNTFTQDTITLIKELLNQKERADGTTQKRLRQRMRNQGFYISDFATDRRGFTARDLDQLIQSGAIRIV